MKPYVRGLIYTAGIPLLIAVLALAFSAFGETLTFEQMQARLENPWQAALDYPGDTGRYLVGHARVYDGDTLVIDGKRVRLYGIDAPEINQDCTTSSGEAWRCGIVARDRLASMVGQSDVRCTGTVDGRDRYGRMLAVCEALGVNLNAQMVADGLALAYRRYATVYAPMEDHARSQKAGLWAGQFEQPWGWRRGGI